MCSRQESHNRDIVPYLVRMIFMLNQLLTVNLDCMTKRSILFNSTAAAMALLFQSDPDYSETISLCAMSH